MDNNLKEAKKVRRKYHRILDHLSIRATCGDRTAAMDLMRKLTEFTLALKALGYRTTSESDDGPPGRLALITEEWKKAQMAKMTKVERLMAKARLASPQEGTQFLREAMLEMSKQGDKQD